MSQYLTTAAKTYMRNYQGLPMQCWLAISLTGIEAIAIGICFFISLYFVNTLHFNIEVAGTLISCYGIGTVIGGILSGRLSDKFSLLKISIASLLIQSLSFLLLTQLHTLFLLAINLFFLGVSSYGFKTANDVWMLHYCKDHSQLRLKAINISRAAMNLGLGISGIIIGIFAEQGFKNIFYIFSLLLFLSTIYLFLQAINKSDRPRASEEFKITNHIGMHSSNKKVIIIMLSCLFLIGLLIAQLSATYPIYVSDNFPYLGIKAVSILYLLDTFLIILLQAPITNALSNQNKILVAGLGAFLMGIGMVVLSFSFNFTLAIISCIIWTTGEMLFMPMAQLVCYEKGSEKKKGQSLGNFQAVYACSSVCGPAVGGFIYYHYNGNILWYLCGITGVVCLLICFSFKKYD